MAQVCNPIFKRWRWEEYQEFMDILERRKVEGYIRPCLKDIKSKYKP